MGLYGQIENVTVNPIAALANSSSAMVGMGLTMEGQEGNEVIYDLLLDQAWSSTSIDTRDYFHAWVTTRYHGTGPLQCGLYAAWERLRRTVYNNTNLATATSVTKSIFELAPNTTGLLNRTGHHSTGITYDPDDLTKAWRSLYKAAKEDPRLWHNDAYTFDLTDITRQVMANAFHPLYESFLTQANRTNLAAHNTTGARDTGDKMIRLLQVLDTMLFTSQHESFRLSSWVERAHAWAKTSPPIAIHNSTSEKSEARNVTEFYMYSARNQVTLWGPTGQVSDYASKQWAGLIGSYYVPRWELFVTFTLNSSTGSHGENDELRDALLAFEEQWQWSDAGLYDERRYDCQGFRSFKTVIELVAEEWISDCAMEQCVQQRS
nr:alpha-n-acetylglucosaminidase [Quercus suber]